MKRILTLLGALCLHQAYAQQEANGRVGINTQTPNATLQVQATTTDPAKGVLIPQMTGDELKTMTDKLTAQQHSMLVFVTKPITDNTAAGFENVILPAYYRFQYDDTKEEAYKKNWVRVEPSGLEKIKQNGKTGWRLIGADPQNYGNIGANAVDLSYYPDISTTYGATGYTSTAMGYGTTASGNTSTAMGLETEASGNASTAMGYFTTASGNYSTAIGHTTTASKYASTAMGLETEASGDYSTAMGYHTTASGIASTAMGLDTKASGEYATAMGDLTTASGRSSVAMGYFTTAQDNLSLVIGAGNLFTSSSSGSEWQDFRYYRANEREAFVIGNGTGYYNTSDNNKLVSNLSNAFIVLRNGKTGIALPPDKQTPANSKPTEMLDVNGKIRTRDAKDNSITVGGTCTNTGTITFSNDKFYGCTSTGWVLLNN